MKDWDFDLRMAFFCIALAIAAFMASEVVGWVRDAQYWQEVSRQRIRAGWKDLDGAD